MQKENKSVCKQFENEVWLYISEELDAERKKHWNSHLSICNECSQLLTSNREVSSLYKENMSHDLLDSTLQKMIEKAVTPASRIERVKESFSRINRTFVFGKIVLGATLVAASLILMLVLQKPVPVIPAASQIPKWDDGEMTMKIQEVSKSISHLEGGTKSDEAEWVRSIKGIESQLDSLKICINN